MATVQRITGDAVITGSLTVSGSITGQARSGIDTDSSQNYELPFQTFRVWDEFARPLPDLAATSAFVVAHYAWDPTVADATFFTSNRDYRVLGITARVEVAGTDGSAVTGAIRKAASGTDIASGTILHASTINLKGTVDTNQTLTLSTTYTDLDIPSGTSIGFDLTGTATTARGTVSVFLVPISPDDLAITQAAFGTGLPYLTTGDVKAAGTMTRRARTMFTIPPEYVAGATVQFRFAAGMVTTVADTTATVDVECYKSARTTVKTGSDLVTTSATSINSVTFGEKAFDLTAGGLSPGDVLDIRVTVAVNDAAGSTAVIGAIAHAEVLLEVKG